MTQALIVGGRSGEGNGGAPQAVSTLGRFRSSIPGNRLLETASPQSGSPFPQLLSRLLSDTGTTSSGQFSGTKSTSSEESVGKTQSRANLPGLEQEEFALQLDGIHSPGKTIDDLGKSHKFTISGKAQAKPDLVQTHGKTSASPVRKAQVAEGIGSTILPPASFAQPLYPLSPISGNRVEDPHSSVLGHRLSNDLGLNLNPNRDVVAPAERQPTIKAGEGWSRTASFQDQQAEPRSRQTDSISFELLNPSGSSQKTLNSNAPSELASESRPVQGVGVHRAVGFDAPKAPILRSTQGLPETFSAGTEASWRISPGLGNVSNQASVHELNGSPAGSPQGAQRAAEVPDPANQKNGYLGPTMDELRIAHNAPMSIPREDPSPVPLQYGQTRSVPDSTSPLSSSPGFGSLLHEPMTEQALSNPTPAMTDGLKLRGVLSGVSGTLLNAIPPRMGLAGNLPSEIGNHSPLIPSTSVSRVLGGTNDPLQSVGGTQHPQILRTDPKGENPSIVSRTGEQPEALPTSPSVARITSAGHSNTPVREVHSLETPPAAGPSGGAGVVTDEERIPGDVRPVLAHLETSSGSGQERAHPMGASLNPGVAVNGVHRAASQARQSDRGLQRTASDAFEGAASPAIRVTTVPFPTVQVREGVLDGHLPAALSHGVVEGTWTAMGQNETRSARSVEGAADVVRNPFLAMDNASASPTALRAQDGGRGLAVGYQDSMLGYVELRAHLAPAGIHASLVTESAASEALLSGHLDALSGWLDARHTPVESVTLVTAGQERSTGAGVTDGAGGEAGREAQREQQWAMPTAVSRATGAGGNGARGESEAAQAWMHLAPGSTISFLA